jgi:hypothetical protein
MATYTAVDPSQALAFGPFAAGDSPAPTGASGSQTVTATGAGEFTWPANISAVTVQCWGGGAGGGGGAAITNAGGSGGGGAFASKLVLGIPGQVYPYVVGAGGAAGATPAGLGGNGVDTTFNTSEVVAKGGDRGATASAGGVGGAASECTGSIKWDGGNGISQDGGDARQGGSSAGTGANGTDADSTSAPCIAPAGGGNGGTGGGDADPGGAGAQPGGGGGGGYIGFIGGAGGAGKIVFTW